MIFAPQVIVRLAAIVLVAVIVQLGFFSHLEIAGTVPDVVPVFVVCLALLAGSLPGAAIGFATGLLVDSALIQTLGASSLALLGAGYLAGRYRELFEIPSVLVPLGLCGSLTAFAVGGFALIQFTLEVDAAVSALVLRDILVKSAVNVVVAAPVWFAVRRALRPALIEDRPLRRRDRTLAPLRA